MDGPLSAEQIEAFHRDGFLVYPGFYSEEEALALRNEMMRLVSEEFTGDHRSVFSTSEQERKADEYFLSSGDKIRFFWEEKAFAKDGKLVQDKENSVNKVGHALHDLNPVFEDFSYKPRLGKALCQLGMKEPVGLQSMYIFKQPKIGGKVDIHQDSTFLYTEPTSCIGLWFAVDDATVENGCLYADPGSHKGALGEIKRRFVRTADNTTTEFRPPTPTQYDIDSCSAKVECKRGTLVFIHGSVVHMSYENHSDKPRHAYNLHCIDGATVYPKDNWLQRGEGLPFRSMLTKQTIKLQQD
mmetsp:Transcript_29159/g.75031  ORF Transcript_29159/g.75031 Transcript_29159/m.75031 type:complete len:298 (+) Transcript_29159:67-960(+)